MLRVTQFNEAQTRRPVSKLLQFSPFQIESNLQMPFWRNFVHDHFYHRATFKYIVQLNDHETRAFQIGIETLPRFYHVIYSSSISSVFYVMENPREYCLDSRTYLLYASKTRVIYKYDNGCEVVSRGFLRVTFSDDLKIVLWEFEAKVHEEYLPMSKIKKELGSEPQRRGSFNFVVKDQGNEKSKPEFEKSSVPTVISVDSLPKSHVNEFGLPPPVMRCFEITEVISYMKDLIDFAQDNNLSPIVSLEKFHQQVAIPEMQMYHQQLQQQQQRQQSQVQQAQSSQAPQNTTNEEAGASGKDDMTTKAEDSKKDKPNENEEDAVKQEKSREMPFVDQSNQFKNGNDEEDNDNQTDEETQASSSRKRTKKTRAAPKANKRRKTKST